MQMSGPDMQPWSFATIPPLFLMWTEMMVPMMVPSATPAVLKFSAAKRKRENGKPFLPAGIFLLGYLTVWTGFSALAAIAQWALHATALLSPMMVSANAFFGGALLIAAGIFQWLPAKTRCLSQCCSPLNVSTENWREGKTGAFVTGLKHGFYCTGCCWILMALLFVAGVMNLWWIAALSALVLVERTIPCGRLLGRIAGVIFAIWGAWMMLHAVAR
ncbi:MAG TPA: DUF2182 domain-containing protein, partial [Verrucomicrobiae bacterium]|nr:DUF2182 domain-containing protein [Verrucomicrobiae bacterium]